MAELKDWIAGYAATLSTLTAAVQLTNAFRDRSRIRIRFWEDSNDKPGASSKHVIVSIANTGRRTLSVYSPQIEVVQHNVHISRIYWRSPDEIAEGYNWCPLDDQAMAEEAFDLPETSERTYRFALGLSDRCLSIRVVDRIGDVRKRKRLLFDRVHRARFAIRHFFWSPAKKKLPKTSPN